jgi:hypothetical protein
MGSNPVPVQLPWGLFPGPNIQVTFDQNRADHTSGSRSECDLAVDPNNPNLMIAAAKRFIENQKYTFTTATSWSANGGDSWTDSSDLWLDTSQPGQIWGGYTDPALACDANSNAYLVSEPIVFRSNGVTDGQGMYVFRSADGGMNWSAPPKGLHVDAADDKQWATADNWGTSNYKGSVYACWGANTPLRFARSTDGNNWTGVGGSAPGADLTQESVFAPAMCVSSDGTIHIAWLVPGTSFIRYVESSDGGSTFSSPQTVVDGITDISSRFPAVDNQFPVFPGGTFRVLTLCTIAPVGAHGCVIAWADCRGAFTRIYYRVRDSGGTWVGDSFGRPVLANMNFADSVPVQHFHPQLAVNQSGLVGCAFYEFGQKPPDNAFRIDVKLASSSFLFQSSLPVDFFFWATVTDQAWDPAVDAPWSHGDPNITFIGEYFGLEAAGDDFCALWTDTRTGKQELWFSRVATWRPKPPRPPIVPPSIVGDILYGVVGDGGGVVLLNGVPIPIPPMGPVRELLPLLAAYGIIVGSSAQERGRLGAEIMNAVARVGTRYGTSAGPQEGVNISLQSSRKEKT